ncbi:MAG: hypothetical protein J7L96_08710 [Bacteroidales bacterium]|nr:hypothetical protein [Bacteroidales bacterium]
MKKLVFIVIVLFATSTFNSLIGDGPGVSCEDCKWEITHDPVIWGYTPQEGTGSCYNGTPDPENFCFVTFDCPSGVSYCSIETHCTSKPGCKWVSISN